MSGPKTLILSECSKTSIMASENKTSLSFLLNYIMCFPHLKPQIVSSIQLHMNSVEAPCNSFMKDREDAMDTGDFLGI